MSRMLDIVMGYDCNAWCDYCTITREMRAKNLPTEEIQKALRAGRSADAGRRPHDHVRFGGGEPTLRSDLVPLVREAHRLGYEDIEVQSNGLRFARGEYVRALIDAGLTAFSISVMSHRDDLYEAITGVPHARRMVLRGIEHILNAATPEGRSRPSLVADVIMKRDTYRHLPALVAFYAERGVPAFVLWLVSLTDRNAAFPRSLVPVRELRPYIEAACAEGLRRGVSVRSRHIPRCMLPGLGEDHFQGTLSEDVTVVTPEGRFALRDSVISANRYPSACARCALRAQCAGVRADYLDHVGDAEVTPTGL